MMIPKRLRVGRRMYNVELVDRLPRNCLGETDYTTRRIKIAQHAHGKRLPKGEVRDTLWHELTHAILHDMGDTLCHNERFVRKFASRLSTAIDTARF